MRFFYLLILILLTACAADKEQSPYKDWTPKKLYNTAKTELTSGTLEQASLLFEQLQASYPASKYSQHSRLELAYALYDTKEYDEAIEKFNQYIELYPNSDNLDYAYYMRGVASQEKSYSFLDGIFIDKAQKNTKGSGDALAYYTRLIDKFPHSKYSKQALQKLQKIQNELAKHELLVAGFYYRKKSYIATINRLQYLIEHYPNTQATPVALTLLKKSYEAIDLRNSAQDAQRLLDINYPNIIIDLKKELDL